MIRNFIVLALIVHLGCTSKSQVSEVKTRESSEPLTYLALGDSYTIGESVPSSLRWPVQLADRFEKAGVEITSPRIIANTGWTTDELKEAIIKAEITQTYDLVSLLIGVNNQYRGYEFDQYEREFVDLLEEAIKFADNRPSKVFVVSIPDYGVTPFGQTKEPKKIASEIDQYNAKAEEISKNYKVKYINITENSRKAASDTTLVANDGLHPSGKMYSEWVDIIHPEVISIPKQ